jgi:ABC-2 type transport system ATP-binding protein
LIAGHDPVTEPLLVRRAFGIVFQDPSLDDELTAAENTELHGVLYRVPRAQRRERGEALLRFVGLWERRDDNVKRFSGGMKRRLEIARALQHRPRILFLDEPTSGLDPQTRNQVWGCIRKLCRDEQATVFFTTHYMEEAERVADQIVVIDHGRIVVEGTAAALRQKTGGRTLEDAFIALTGHSIREDEAVPVDRMRMMRQVWRGRHEPYLHPVAAAIEAPFPLAHAHDRLARPADPVPLGARFRARAHFRPRRPRRLRAVSGAGRRHDGILFTAVFSGIEIIHRAAALFFSSALFPVPDLPGAVRLAVRLNPLSYGVDGLRSALSGGAVFGVATDFAVLGGLAAILLAIGAYLFSKIEV